MSVADPDHLSPPRRSLDPRPLRTTSIVIYATLAMLALTIPQAPVNWLKGFEPSKVQDLALDVALSVQSLSNWLGIDVPFSSARRLFLDATGKREE